MNSVSLLDISQEGNSLLLKIFIRRPTKKLTPLESAVFSLVDNFTFVFR